MDVLQKARTSEILSVKNFYTQSMESLKMKNEEEKVILIRELELKLLMKEESVKKQIKEYMIKEQEHAKGLFNKIKLDAMFIFLVLFSYDFFFFCCFFIVIFQFNYLCACFLSTFYSYYDVHLFQYLLFIVLLCSFIYLFSEIVSAVDAAKEKVYAKVIY